MSAPVQAPRVRPAAAGDAICHAIWCAAMLLCAGAISGAVSVAQAQPQVQPQAQPQVQPQVQPQAQPRSLNAPLEQRLSPSSPEDSGAVGPALLAVMPAGVPPPSEAAPSSRQPRGEPVTPLTGIAPIYPTDMRARLFRYSLAVSSGYETGNQGAPQPTGGFTVAEGYGGMHLQHRHFSLLLQHDAQLMRSPQLSTSHSGAGMEQYQLTAASFTGTESRHTNWSVLLENGYGSDVARAAGSLGTSVLNAVVVPNPNVVASSLTSGNILSDHALFTVNHNLSESRTLNLIMGSYFHHFFDVGTSDQQYRLDGGFRQRWSTRQTVGVEAMVVRENDPLLRCTTGSVGLYGFTQITHNIRFEGTVGPAWGSAYCSGDYAYNASLAADLAHGGLLYVGSARQRNDGLVRESTWEDSTFGGFAIGQVRRVQVRASAGYSSYMLLHPTPANPNLHGYFISGELHHRLSSAAEVSFTTRYFYRGQQGSAPNGNILLAASTFTWSPEERSKHHRSQRNVDDSH